MSQITILFVDDHPLIRKAWAFLFKRDPRFQLIAECDNGEKAVELARLLCPDIVIMDIRMPGMSGIEATGKIREVCPNAKVIGLSFHILPEFGEKIIQNGARGYLTKISSDQEIFNAILEVSQGRMYICEEMRDKMNIRY